MTFSYRSFCRMSMIVALIASLLSPALYAQGRSVTASELRDAVRQASSARQKNLEQVRSFFSDATVRKALADAHMDQNRIQKAVSALDPGELARFAARTAQVQNDFAAGALSNQDLTYVVIALAAAVLVIVLVAA